METKFDPNNRPERGVALFRWMAEKKKWEEANPRPLTEEEQKIIAELKKENAERGTALVQL